MVIISKYLAHIATDGRKETVYQHLCDTAEMSKKFADAFGCKEYGEFVGLLHDIGKYSEAFQRRLCGSSERVDHSTAGAVECCKMRQPEAAFVVAGHHGGLPDLGGKADNSDQSTLFGRLKKDLEDYRVWEEKNIKNKLPNLQSCKIEDIRRDQSEDMFFTRMLFSCLVDADFLCTECFMKNSDRLGNATTMQELEKRLDAYTKDWFPPQTPLNKKRCDVLTQCRKKGKEEKPGLFTLTVPTGGGKTVSSLAFALAHAEKYGKNRIIYVIPYTNIIEQNAQVFRDILGKDAVLEHHSGIVYDLCEEARPETINMAAATENWDMPIIVTTAVQFFESLFAARSSKCRKLHNLANSVIIFDEAQMIPVSYLRPCVFAISQLIKYYGVSAVLCTATQPALGPIFHEFIPGIKSIEICPENITTDPLFRRVVFQKKGKLTYDELAQTLNDLSQVLCIVNSRKAAQETFSRLKGEGNFHLSTFMYPTHRYAVLDNIRNRLAQGLPCRVVSTSLIEAGVDVDFPRVFREEAGLDSILQAAGRCNREGKNAARDSVVTIFSGEDRPPKLFSIPIFAGKEVVEKYEDIAGSEAIAAYFNKLLYMKGNEAQDEKEILRIMKEESFSFRVIEEKFNLIDNAARVVYIPLGEGKELTERLRCGERSRDLFRRLGKFGVNVYENSFKKLVKLGALEELEDGSAILLDITLYDEEKGLIIPNEDKNEAAIII